MKYRLVIFDFDGTLADSFPWFTGAVREAAVRYGFTQVPEHEIESLRGYGGRELLGRLKVPLGKLPLVARHLRRAMRRDVSAIELFDGIDELLRDLSDRGVTLAVVSSNSCRNVRRVLGPANAERIDFYECDVSMFGKAARFRRVLRRSGVAPTEAICVGDEVRDQEAATAAGIAFGAVAWGFNSLEALQRRTPDEVFREVAEIAELVS